MKKLIVVFVCLYSVTGLGSESFNYTQCESKIGSETQHEGESVIVTRAFCNTELINASTELAIAMDEAASNYRATQQPCKNFDSQKQIARQYIIAFRGLSMGVIDVAGLADDNIVFGLFQIEDILKYADLECNTTYLKTPISDSSKQEPSLGLRHRREVPCVPLSGKQYSKYNF